MKSCNRCGISKPVSEFYPAARHRFGVHSTCKECVKATSKAHYWNNREKHAAYFKDYYQRNREKYLGRAKQLRQRVLDAYGNRCMCCGETTPEFLGIDHVNNDGGAHRRELKGYGRSINRWLSMNGFPQDGRFQLLCHNCNMAKGAYGSCPHQRAA